MSRFFVIAGLLLSCAALSAQDQKDYIVATRRAGVIEFIDPATLQTVAQIHYDLPPKSAGLNGAAASADGSTLYVQGPVSKEYLGCCSLYSIDLATLKTSLAAGISGTISRETFAVSDGIVTRLDALTA